MISKVMQVIGVKGNYSVKNKTENGLNNKNSQMQNPIQSNLTDSRLSQSYYLSFGASATKKSKRQSLLEDHFSYEAKQLVGRASEIAAENGQKEIGELHIEKAAMESIRDYLKDLEKGEKVFDSGTPYQLPAYFADQVTPDVFKDRKVRAKIIPVVDEEIKILSESLEKIKQTNALKVKPTVLAEKIVDSVYGCVVEEGTKSISAIEDAVFLSALYETNDKQEENSFRKFLMKFSEAVMLDGRKPEEKISLSIYKGKARNVLNNLAHGTNMFVTYDKNVEPVYMVDTIADVFAKEEKGFGNLNKNNTKLHVFNSKAREPFIQGKVRELVKNQDVNHIMLVDLNGMLHEFDEECKDLKTEMSSDFTKLMEEPPKNLKIVLVDNKNAYYSYLSDSSLKKTFENFGEATVPVLSAEQTKRIFREQPLLMKKTGVNFSKKAIDKIVDACALLDGSYPDKAQRMMKKLASYYVGKKEISEKDVAQYLKETKDVVKVATENNSVEVVFNTEKKLKDFLGKEATQKEVETLIRQIKSQTLGTKGAVIYSQDGSVGAGRKFTAKVIAGETKSPYVEINAEDFGTKETSLFGSDTMSPENSMRKLFSLLKTQAEANPKKSAVLFIENFEYFSVGEQVSEYHQKAMSQLLREMENADKNGLNLLILGSVRDPELIGDSTLKSFKFTDTIEVESPSRNLEAREKILSSFVKKEKIKLAGATDAEKQALTKLMAETTDDFPFVHLTNLVKKVKSVATERKHKEVEKSDIVEAYLRLTTGRPSSKLVPEHSKKIVASHECGHGFNLQYMRRLAEEQNIPWHLNSKVNFITLDPRGWYGGAMYPKNGGNEEHTFERIFSNLVCDYGGYSAEKHFYNIDGSWGITGDMAMATAQAESAVGSMGQGKNFGKKSLEGMHMNLSQKSLEVFEKDRDVILDNARTVSDLITKFGTTFNQQFTQKYAKFVGTGDCLVHGDDFRKEITQWFGKQTKGKLAEMAQVDKTILKIIEASKQGKRFNMNSESVPKAVRVMFKSVASYIK